MAKLVDNRDRSNPYSRIMSGITPFQHKAHYRDEKDHSVDKETIFRIIPEYAADGSRLPMVIAGGGEDLDYSNIHEESVTLFAGESDLYTGWGRPSDRDIADSVEMVFPGIYIRLKGRDNKNELSDALSYRFSKLTKRVNNRQAMERPSEVRLVQCIIIKACGKVLEKPATFQGLILSKMAAVALNRLLVECNSEGKDIFSPENGHLIHLDSSIHDDDGTVREIAKHSAKLGKPFPLKEEQCKKLWVPWENVFVRDTFETQIRKAVKAFGEEVVKEVFPEDHARYFGAANGGGIISDDEEKPAEGKVITPERETNPEPSAPAVEIDLENRVDLEGEGDAQAEAEEPFASPNERAAAKSDGPKPEESGKISRPSKAEQEAAYEDVLAQLDDIDI